MTSASFSAAERAATRLPPLLLAASRVAATLTQGSHGRRRAGPGETFWQFRPYTPGDSLRSIDWRQTGKSDRTHVRDREWMAAQSVALWVDSRPSMAWRSDKALPTKAERATVLGLALALVLARAGERIGCLGQAQQTGALSFAPGPWWSGQHAASRLAEYWALTQPSQDSRPAHGQPLTTPDVAAAPAFVPRSGGLQARTAQSILPSRARVVLFTDALDPLDQIEQALRSLGSGAVGPSAGPTGGRGPGRRNQGHRGHLVQILDPAEDDFSYQGRMLFTAPGQGPAPGPQSPPAEGQESPWLVPRAEDIQQDYRQRLAAHRDGLTELTRRLGWTLSFHRTDHPADRALRDLYGHLQTLPSTRDEVRPPPRCPAAEPASKGDRR